MASGTHHGHAKGSRGPRKQSYPDYTGILARVTNDVTLATYHDLRYDDDLADYDGWKVLYLYDQVSEGAMFYQLSYAAMPSVNATKQGLEFNGTSEYLLSVQTPDLFAGSTLSASWCPSTLTRTRPRAYLHAGGLAVHRLW